MNMIERDKAIPKWLACSRCGCTLPYRVTKEPDRPPHNQVVLVDCCVCDGVEGVA
jgi:hypothetical protein